MLKKGDKDIIQIVVNEVLKMLLRKAENLNLIRRVVF